MKYFLCIQWKQNSMVGISIIEENSTSEIRIAESNGWVLNNTSYPLEDAIRRAKELLEITCINVLK